MDIIFFSTIYSLCAENKPRHALEIIFDTLDDRILENDIDFVVNFLDQVDLTKLAPTCILGLFSVLYPASIILEIKNSLISLYPKALKELSIQLNDENRAEKLLNSFKNL